MLTTAGPTSSTTRMTALEYASRRSPSPGAVVSFEGGVSRAAATSGSTRSPPSPKAILAMSFRSACARSRVRQAPSRSLRQLDDEPSPAPELAVDADPAVMALYDALHDREPEAGAVLLVLGREEGREDVRRVLRSDPGPVVLDDDDDDAPTCRIVVRGNRRGH